MYLIRRVAKTQPGKAWEVAGYLSKICAAYEQAGRSKAQIYIGGQGLPGTPNTVYAEWTQDSIEPNWPTNIPDTVRPDNAQMLRCERLTADIDAEVIQVNVDTGAVTIEGDPVAKLELRERKRCRSRNESHDPAGERRQGSHPDRKRSPSGQPKFELLGTRAPVKFVW